MLGTGVRIGEACALRWSAVDVGAGVARIEATTVRVRGRGLLIQDFPKTTAGRRIIAAPEWVIDLLDRRRQHQPGPADGARPRRLRLGHLAGVPKDGGARLDGAGLSARQIADPLGHTRPSLTQDVYVGRRLASPEAAAALDRPR